MHTHLQQINFGDDTPRSQGRLNLNPFSHLEPIGFIMLIVAGFGWGRPVQIDPRNFNGKHSLSKAEAIVAAAGPIMNFILAFVFLVIFRLILIFWTEAAQGFYMYLTGAAKLTSIGWPGLICVIVEVTASINIGLGVFNLIPLPPLDGSKILMHFLPTRGKEWFINSQQIFYIVFLVIWITGLAGTILSPLFGYVLEGMDWVVINIFKLLGLI